MFFRYFLIFLCSSTFLFAQQEKRLALVIGNSNYERGELKNPVNDAKLIASTLDSLNFDVILKENLPTKREMVLAIREFGNKRSEYDVAFVYYAGHGIQINDENFLLPTKEFFESQDDVLDFGVSVQNIMRYLEGQTNQVNILILDACRDNPFESNWNSTRSLKGSGLAKIPPPTGSLIAFSTDSGMTAPDGDGENSIYTISLAKNMQLVDTSIDQVFRNVRAEVLAQTAGVQRPVEATQLTGQTFYLKLKSIENLFNNLMSRVDSLSEKGDYIGAISLLNNFKIKDSLNIRGYTDLGILSFYNQNIKNSLKFFQKAFEIDSLNCENNRAYSLCLSEIERGRSKFANPEKNKFLSKNYIRKDSNKTLSLFRMVEQHCDSINMFWAKEMISTSSFLDDKTQIEKLLEINSVINKKNSQLYDPESIMRISYNIGVNFGKIGEHEKAISHYKNVIDVYTNNKNEGVNSFNAINAYGNMATEYWKLNDYNKCEYYLSKAYELNPNDILNLSNLGYLNILLQNYQKANKYLNIAMELEPKAIDPVQYKSILLHIEKKYLESNNLIDNFLNNIKNEDRLSWGGSNLYLKSIKAFNFYELNMRYEAISSVPDLSNKNYNDGDEYIAYYNFTRAFILKKMFNDNYTASKIYDQLNEEAKSSKGCDFDCKYFNNY